MNGPANIEITITIVAGKQPMSLWGRDLIKRSSLVRGLVIGLTKAHTPMYIAAHRINRGLNCNELKM